jgi:threonine/homoserine/homoserine lactone efflux protein
LPLSIETLTIFTTASILLAMAPGPDNIFVLAQSALHGRAAGFCVTLGLCTGLLFHISAVTLGVAGLFATSELAFNILKLVGVAYLLYLAWQAFRARVSSLSKGDAKLVNYRKYYIRGIVMNITNPKVAIFFLAFLPQFAEPSNGSLSIQLLLFGAVFILVTLVVFGTIAVFSGAWGGRLRTSATAQLVLNRLAGTVFAGLALWLIAAQR